MLYEGIEPAEVRQIPSRNSFGEECGRASMNTTLGVFSAAAGDVA